MKTMCWERGLDRALAARTTFAALSMEDEKILRNWENSIQIRLLWNANSELCVQKKSADCPERRGWRIDAHSPRGRESTNNPQLVLWPCHVGGTLCETGDRSALDSTNVNRTARSASLATTSKRRLANHQAAFQQVWKEYAVTPTSSTSAVCS